MRNDMKHICQSESVVTGKLGQIPMNVSWNTNPGKVTGKKLLGCPSLAEGGLNAFLKAKAFEKTSTIAPSSEFNLVAS